VIGFVTKSKLIIVDIANLGRGFKGLLFDVHRPILIGGGRNNNILRNVILQGNQSIWIDDRALQIKLDS
jgi:hypothetical protein